MPRGIGYAGIGGSFRLSLGRLLFMEPDVSRAISSSGARSPDSDLARLAPPGRGHKPSPIWSVEDDHQECLLRLLRSPPRDPRALRAAYRTTLRNLRADHARAAARAPQVTLDNEALADAHQQDPSQSAENREVSKDPLASLLAGNTYEGLHCRPQSLSDQYGLDPKECPDGSRRSKSLSDENFTVCFDFNADKDKYPEACQGSDGCTERGKRYWKDENDWHQQITVQVDCGELPPDECLGLLLHELVHVNQIKQCALRCNAITSREERGACWDECWHENDHTEDPAQKIQRGTVYILGALGWALTIIDNREIVVAHINSSIGAGEIR